MSQEGSGIPPQYSSLSEAVRQAYISGEEDERLEPIIVVNEEGEPMGRLQNGDSVIFYDIRGEREIEITQSLIDRDFKEFPIGNPLDLNFATMIQYHKDLNVDVAFPPQGEVKDTLCHVLSQNEISFIKIVESEKAQHLTYFFNGKSREPLPMEKRLIIPSNKVSLPDSDPKMKVAEVAEAIKKELNGDTPVIIANLANVDVVGHTENEEAIISAVEAVDNALGEIIDTAKQNNITSIVTADHGTVESWLYPDGTIDTGHTRSQVPFILVEPDPIIQNKIELRDSGELSDVAPTAFEIMGLSQPEIMTGESLLKDNPYAKSPRKRLLLLILDGWGVNEASKGNLIHKARTPVMDGLTSRYPFIHLSASQEAVGMPEGSVGNSEVGHLHLGAGRRIASDRLRIDNAISDGAFFQNPAFLRAMEKAKVSKTNLHLLGIVSFYSSHGSLDHLKALLEMAKQKGPENVYVHCILGRRGERKQSGERYIDEVEKFTKKLNTAEVVTVIGRHWVLDREENWDRIRKSRNCLVLGMGNRVIVNR